MFEIIALLIKKKPPKTSKKLRRKLYISIGKKSPKLDEKTKTKTARLDK